MEKECYIIEKQTHLHSNPGLFLFLSKIKLKNNNDTKHETVHVEVSGKVLSKLA